MPGVGRRTRRILEGVLLILAHMARILPGLIFLAFWLNGFFLSIPVPEFHPFVSILVSSGYIYLIKTVEVVGGVPLLSNR